MKTHKKAGRKLFYISLIGFLISACSVWLVPLVMDNEDGNLSYWNITIGIVFWIGLLAGILFFIIAWIKVKNDTGYKITKETKRPGYISFFSNRLAAVSDGLLIISLIVTITGSYLIRMPAGILVPVLFLGLYSLYLHFMFNGRVYSYILKSNHKKKKERENEKQD